MREAAWVVLLAVVVVFVVLVAIEVGKRSEYRSPVDLAADLFTKTNVRNVAPTSSLVTNANGGAEMAAAGADEMAGDDLGLAS